MPESESGRGAFFEGDDVGRFELPEGMRRFVVRDGGGSIVAAGGLAIGPDGNWNRQHLLDTFTQSHGEDISVIVDGESTPGPEEV